MFWAFIFVSIFFSFALGMLWGSFQTLQIVLAMPLLIVKMPANVIVVFKGFTDIINMNMIDKKILYENTIGIVLPENFENSDRPLLRILNNSVENITEISPM